MPQKLWKRLTSYFLPYEIAAIIVIIVSSILLRVILIDTRPFQSDESIYVYASYAITRGVTPYREIFLAQPPLMFFIFVAFIKLVGTSLTFIRILNYGIFALTIFLTHLMCRFLLNNQKGVKIGLLCATLYGFYPMVLALSITASAESILTFFTLSAVVVYTRYSNSANKKLLLLAGFLLGLALITKFTAATLIVVLMLYHIVQNFQKKRYKVAIIGIALISLGIVIPVAVAFSIVAIDWRALSQFYQQTYYLQTIRSPFTLSERLGTLTSYAGTFSFLLMTGALGAFYIFRNKKNPKNPSIWLPAWIYGINAFVLILFPISLLHYFLYLTPYVAFLSAYFLQKASVLLNKKSLLSTKIMSKKGKIIFPFFVILLGFIVFQTANSVIPQIQYFGETQYTKAEIRVATYVADVTDFDDKIWTSEPAIAFFAHRLIVAPNSSDWPFQGFFYDVFNITYNGHNGLGIVSPNQFIEAWEREKVKVIIFVRGSGWVPYPDEVLWDGFQNQRGVANYVTKHYVLIRIFKIAEIPYTYEIWLRM